MPQMRSAYLTDNTKYHNFLMRSEIEKSAFRCSPF